MGNGVKDDGPTRGRFVPKWTWRRRWGELDHQTRDNIIVGVGGLVYAVLLGWPLYNLAVGRSQPENFTLLGGMIGLMLAAYAIMTNRMVGSFRWIAGATGLLVLVLCLGFGPL
jgi:hypothetical protein